MSVRNTVLDGIVTLLKTIKPSTYVTTPSNVVRKFLNLDQVKEFPVLMVLGGDEQFENVMGNVIYSTMNIKIRGFAKNVDNPEDALCDLIADVLKCLFSSGNLYAGNIWVDEVMTDEGYISAEKEGVTLFEISVRIKYEFPESTP